MGTWENSLVHAKDGSDLAGGDRVVDRRCELRDRLSTPQHRHVFQVGRNPWLWTPVIEPTRTYI